MSHFTVAVLCKDANEIDEKLEPFQEEVKSDSPYASFSDQTEEVLDGWKALGGEIKGKERTIQKAIGTIPNYKTIEEYATEYHGFVKRGDKFGYVHNTEAKWDWYAIGGRWTGLLLLKAEGLGVVGKPGLMTEPNTDPMRADIAKIKDIDFPNLWKAQQKEAEGWWRKFKASKDSHAAFEYGVHKGDTKKMFVARHANKHLTRAVLDLNGEWHEPGSMGWFGASSESDAELKNFQDGWMARFITPLDPETYIAIIDCHI